jgi:hypothetical protein
MASVLVATFLWVAMGSAESRGATSLNLRVMSFNISYGGDELNL